MSSWNLFILVWVHSIRKIPIILLKSIRLLACWLQKIFVWGFERLFTSLHHLEVLFLKAVYWFTEIQNIHVTNTFQIALSVSWFELKLLITKSERIKFVWVLNKLSFVVIEDIWIVYFAYLVVPEWHIIFGVFGCWLPNCHLERAVLSFLFNIL